MKRTNYFIGSVLIFFILSCGSTKKEKDRCLNAYLNPTTITCTSGELFTFYLIGKNCCNESLNGCFEISLPKGLKFKDVSKGREQKDTLKREIGSLNIRMDGLNPNEKRTASIVIEPEKGLTNTKLLIKIRASSSGDSTYVDLSKFVFIK